ncbi:MAG: P27 family phage terminase small subunit [Leptolyngbya sp. SIO3F4]|nr:P27 family phage terminase small subunit [Leptolyngbya sp. SIO3F4]
MPQLLAHEKWEPLYVGMFSTLCEAYAEMVAIKQEINEGGWTEHGNRGLKKNPLAQTFNDARNAYRMFAREFGMSPLTVNRAEKSAMSQKPAQTKLSRFGI